MFVIHSWISLFASNTRLRILGGVGSKQITSKMYIMNRFEMDYQFNLKKI